jgi:hypothetical protein
MRPLAARRLSSFVPVVMFGGLLVSAAGCGSSMPGEASSYVMIRSLQGASGAEPDTFSGTLASDVQTLVESNAGGDQVETPTVYQDPGRVVFELAMKNPTGLEPTTTNYVTFTRYRVTYIRSDGRNVPGVDVPHPFDGALTVTVGDQPATASLTLVRLQAKLENPLLGLVGGGGALAITTLAEVTFYGADQTGKEVSSTGTITVTFADWGDPE